MNKCSGLSSDPASLSNSSYKLRISKETAFWFGITDIQTGSVRLFRGAFHPHCPCPARLLLKSSAADLKESSSIAKKIATGQADQVIPTCAELVENPVVDFNEPRVFSIAVLVISPSAQQDVVRAKVRPTQIEHARKHRGARAVSARDEDRYAIFFVHYPLVCCMNHPDE